MKNKSMGGEYEIDPNLLKDNKKNLFSNEQLSSSGRSAFYEILIHLKTKTSINTIYIPNYICNSIIDTAFRAGVSIKFYHLDRTTFHVERNFFTVTSNSAILLVNYFGMLDIEQDIEWIKRNNNECIVILDNVQAFFEMYNSTKADYIFTSFRKTFPVPEGGWIRTKDLFINHLRIEDNTFGFYKLVGGIIKEIKHLKNIDDSIYLHFFEKGEIILDSEFENKLNIFTLRILDNLAYDEIKNQRIQNAKYLVEGLNKLGIETMIPYNEKKVPLFIPILLENRDKVRETFFSKRIFCPIHWPVMPMYKDQLTLGYNLFEREMSLIIDQRYTIEDMNTILEIFKKS